MDVPARDRIRSTLLRYIEAPGARLLRALGFTPDSVTVLGFAITVAASVLVGFGFLIAGGLVFLAGGVFDLLDGALARLTGKVSNFGALLDSTVDRLGEGALFLGIAVYALRADLSDDRLLFFIVALFLAMVASQTVSYLRARGEALGISSKIGLMTRPERVVLLSLGLLLGQRGLEVVLVLIAAVSFLTMFHRLFHIQRSLGVGPESSQGPTAAGVDKGDDPL